MAGKINDGGPAFPVPIAATTNGDGDPCVWDAQERCLAGMSVRVWLAGKALEGMSGMIEDIALLAAVNEAMGPEEAYQAAYQLIGRRSLALADAVIDLAGLGSEGGAA